MRNSRAVDICKNLATYGIKVKVVDPVVNKNEFKHELGIELVELQEVKNADCIVFLVAHQQFKEISTDQLDNMFKLPKQHSKNVLIDIKNIFNRQAMEAKGYSYWSL